MKFEKEVAEYVLSKWIYYPESGLIIGVRGKPIGRVDSEGYRQCTACIGRERIMVSLHRAAWLLMKEVWPTDPIDHINGVRDDNRWANLREAPGSGNHQNRALQKRISGLPYGVNKSPKNKTFDVRIGLNRKQHYGGCFKTVEEAAARALELKAELHTFNPVQRTTTTS